MSKKVIVALKKAIAAIALCYGVFIAFLALHRYATAYAPLTGGNLRAYEYVTVILLFLWTGLSALAKVLVIFRPFPQKLIVASFVAWGVMWFFVSANPEFADALFPQDLVRREAFWFYGWICVDLCLCQMHDYETAVLPEAKANLVDEITEALKL